MKTADFAFLVAAAAFLALFLFYPLAYVFKEAFLPEGELTLSFFATALSSPVIREAMLNSVTLAATATVLTAAVSIPLAALAVRFSFPAKGLLTGLLLLPMIMPPFVGAVGMRQFLARFGPLNLLLMHAGLISTPIDWLGGARFWGVVIMMTLHLYPIMYLNVAAALANVDPALQEAASNLGSCPLRVFRKVTLPLAMPGLYAGAVIVFIWALTDLGTPLVFEYRRVVPVLIFDSAADAVSNPEGSALVTLLIAATTAMFVASKKLFGRTAHQTLGKGGSAAAEVRLGRIGSVAIACVFLAVITASCLPHLSVALTSIKRRWFMTVLPESVTFDYYRSALGHKYTLPSIRNSILLSGISTTLDLALGVGIAYHLARRRFPGADLLDACAMLPLAVPGLVLAFGYVATFSGGILDPRENPMPLLAVAYAVRRLPYMTRAAYAGFQQISVTLEEAALNLGSTPLRTLRRVTAPLISANLIAGAILAFSFAMLEVSDSLILAVKEQFYPITKAIYQLLGRIEDGACMASALGVWAMVFLGLALVLSGMLVGRRMGQMFRV